MMLKTRFHSTSQQLEKYSYTDDEKLKVNKTAFAFWPGVKLWGYFT